MGSGTPRADSSHVELPSPHHILPWYHQRSRSPPEPLQLAGRILERAAPRHSQGAEYFDVMEYSLALPIALLYLVSKQGEKEDA